MTTYRVLAKWLTALFLLAGMAAAHAEDLMDIYRLALDNDPQLRAAEAGYRAALEVKPQSRAALLPSLDLGANFSRNHEDIKQSPYGSAYTGTTDFNSRGYSLSLVQPLYHRDYFVQLRQADARISQAEAQYGTARQGLILRVAGAYFNLLSAKDNLDFAEAEKRAIAQQLRQTKQRFDVGLTAITDVREAQARYDLAVAQEIVARNGLDTAREALREITGGDHQDVAPVKADIPLITPDPENIDRWVDTAMQQNLSLIAAEAAARVAADEVKRRRAGHYPTLDVVANHAYTDNTDAAFGTESEDTSLRLQLSVPLYHGGMVSSQVREAQHLYDEARETLEQQRRATVRQARDTYLGVMAGISQVKALKQALSSTQTALEATQAGFEVGTRTTVDVLDSQREVYRSQRDYARSRYDYILATLRLKEAAGTLGVPDLEQVAAWLK